MLPLLALALQPGAAAAARSAEPWMDRADPPAHRAAVLLEHMTLEEKISLLHGPPTGPCCQCKSNASCAYVGNINAIPRLKIPPVSTAASFFSASYICEIALSSSSFHYSSSAEYVRHS